MLVKFQVKNFKKFKDEIIFDLSNTRNYSFNEEVIKGKILNKALIYGSNGSGKSNLGFAIFDIIFHTTDNEKIKKFYENYLYGNGIIEKKAEFIYTFKILGESVIYKYTKENRETLLTEELLIGGKRVLYLDRVEEKIEVNMKEAKNLKIDDILNTNLSLLKYISNNAILITNPVYTELMIFLRSMLWLRSISEDNYMGYSLEYSNIINEEILDLNSIKKEENLTDERKRKLLNLNLKKFEDFLKESGIYLELEMREESGQIYIDVNVDNQRLPFYEVASSGTIALVNFYIWYKKLDTIKFLFIDEFDSFYHYKLSKLIIKKLKEKINTQVILTTHSTNLMDNELLRPDCYFVLKNNKIKSLPELTEKELREAHNIEKLFKSGTFDE